MLRKVLGAVLIILGLAAAGLGVASATYWREPDSVVSVAVPQGDGTLVTTAPGVLELVGPDVTVVASVPGDGKVTVAVGRTLDVEGWIGIDHSTSVDGLTDWETLSTSAVVPEIPEPAEGADPPEPGLGADPAGNDMWLAESSGEGSATLRWSDRPGRWSLLAAGVGEDAQAPTIELTWPRVASTPWLWPGVGTGAALLVAGLLVLFVRRKGKPAADGTASDGPADDGGPEAAKDQDEVAAAPPSRRSRRRVAQTAASTETQAPQGSALDGAKEAPGEVSAQPEPEAGTGTDVQASAESVAPAATARRWPFSSATGGAGGKAPTRRGLVRREVPAEPLPDEALVPDAQVSSAAAPSPLAKPALRPWGTAGADEPPSSTPAVAEPTAVDGAEPVTGSMPRITRRELREQEEARRAAAQTGLTGRIRALTGSIPVVRPTPARPPAAGTDAPATRASRSQAWRQAWGFDADADSEKNTGNDSEGGTR